MYIVSKKQLFICAYELYCTVLEIKLFCTESVFLLPLLGNKFFLYYVYYVRI